MKERIFIALIPDGDSMAISEVVNGRVTEPSDEDANRIADLVQAAIDNEQAAESGGTN